ncbi:MAG: hypothetical protein DCC71_22625 [Proteobacteria bacterium]|nr:MAG: hypothetical protein DCC71_22625 [Pseudomonadota bacterium]
MAPPARARSVLRMPRIALVIALGIAAAPAAARADAPEAAPEADAGAPRVLGVAFEGAQAVSPSELAKRVDTQPRSRLQFWKERPALDVERVAADAERLERFYRTRGYFEAQVRAEIDWNETRDAAHVRFEIEEGEPVRLAERGIEVPPPFDAAELTRDLPLEEGDVFSLDRYDDAKARIQERLAEQGHPLAEVPGGADVWAPEHTARLTWRVEPGPFVRFGPVRVEGGDAVAADLVEQEIEVREGEPYSLEAISETRAGLTKLGVFGSVVVQPQPGEATADADGVPRWPVAVRLAERPARTLKLGLGWGTDDRWRAQLRWDHRNVFGRAERFQAQAFYSSIERSFRIDYDVPHWLARDQTLHAESWLGQEDTVAYEAVRLVGAAGVQRDFAELWSARLGVRGSWNEVLDSSRVARRELNDPERAFVLAGLYAGLRRSTVDDLVDPTRGLWLDLDVAPTLPLLGSEETFVTVAAEARAYRPFRDVVLAGRLRLATIAPFGSTGARDVPLVARLYSGGGSSVRGFAYQGLGPDEVDGKPIGGASLFEANAELRFPIRGALRGVAFVDAGRVDLEPARWKLGGVVFSLGAGLRYATPLGPVRVDVAFPIGAPDDAERSFFYVSIGQSF